MLITKVSGPVFQNSPSGDFQVSMKLVVTGKVSVIVPTYEEAENIRPFLIELCTVLEAAVADYEVLVVDDDSADETWRHACDVSQLYPAIRVIRRKGERGLASAVIRGFQASTGEILGTINADFQHPVEVLGEMLKRIRGADLIVASRFCKGGGTGDWAQERLMMSRAAFQAGRFMLPQVFSELTDPLSGYYLFRRRIIDGIAFRPVGFKTLIEIIARGKVSSLAECPYQMQTRRGGKSKARLKTFLDYLSQLVRLQPSNES